MGRRTRRQVREKINPDLPLPIALNLNEPIGNLDHIIEKTEESLKEMKRLRVLLVRDRGRRLNKWRNME